MNGGVMEPGQARSAQGHGGIKHTPSPKSHSVPLLDDELLLALAGVFLVDLLLFLLLLHVLVRSASLFV